MFVPRNKYVKGDIVSFKLVNGDEIIAEFSEFNSDYWTIKRPCTVVPSAQGIGLMQSLFSGNMESAMFLRADHVMLHTETISEIKSHYIKTTTGIDVPAKPSIIV
ncbi:hypothetical protein UFOVP116_94 [uncultured Caudovirales phage]|uniref:Uncharacterized protein n=1 Tax=uncultured Caudovirales phage TaxID=2100421 RepID=A0A6J5L5X3_9CAUD|nr:hypothetical protein UFOVP116_94 [uncultured Caudovirales phage]